jgi:hypothetical protein
VGWWVVAGDIAPSSDDVSNGDGPVFVHRSINTVSSPPADSPTLLTHTSPNYSQSAQKQPNQQPASSRRRERRGGLTPASSNNPAHLHNSLNPQSGSSNNLGQHLKPRKVLLLSYLKPNLQIDQTSLDLFPTVTR